MCTSDFDIRFNGGKYSIVENYSPSSSLLIRADMPQVGVVVLL